MVNIGAVKTRVSDLLTYFSKEYVKAYKSALVESLRNKANGIEGGEDEAGRPEFTLPLLDENRLPVPLPRVEGVVSYGTDLKEVRHWSMDKKFIVTQTEIKKEKGAAASSSSAAGPASPTSPMSPMSPTPAGAVAGDGQADQRIWLDDSCTEVCMNPACGEKFGQSIHACICAEGKGGSLLGQGRENVSSGKEME